MLSSEQLTAYVRALAQMRGLSIEDAWMPGVEMSLRRLLEAAALVDESELRSDDLAPRFEP